MRYIKDYTTFLFEKKEISFVWNDVFNRLFNMIEDKAKLQKIQKFLMKDIFDSVINKSIILTDDDKKVYSQSNTITKFGILMNLKYAPQMDDRYRADLANITDYARDLDTQLSDMDVSNFEELITKADEYHERLANEMDISQDGIRTDETEDTDVFIKYPNGWYWINLNTSYSQDEANNMGHCGQDYGKILFSLRDENKKSHITVAYDPKSKALHQTKGVKNSKPKPQYFKYIVDMILNTTYDVNLIKTGSYKPELDFSLTDLPETEMKAIYKKKPSLEMTDKMFDVYREANDMKSMLSMCSNGFVYDGYMRYTDKEDIKKVFAFIEEQKIKDISIILRIIQSIISLLVEDVCYYDESILKELKKYDVKLIERGTYKYPNIKTIKKYFDVEINDPTLVKQIYEYNKEAVDYILSTKKFKLSSLILKSLCDDTLSLEMMFDILNKIDYSDYKLNITDIAEYFRYQENANLIYNKIEYFIENLKSNANSLHIHVHLLGYARNEKAKSYIIELLFKHKKISEDDISIIINYFDTERASADYIELVMKEMVKSYGSEKILSIIMDTYVPLKAHNIFHLNSAKKDISNETFYKLVSAKLNEIDDLKYYYLVLRNFTQYDERKEDDIITISEPKRKILLKYVENLYNGSGDNNVEKYLKSNI